FGAQQQRQVRSFVLCVSLQIIWRIASDRYEHACRGLHKAADRFAKKTKAPLPRNNPGSGVRLIWIKEVYGWKVNSDFTENWPDNRMSCDEAPTRTLYVPGSPSHWCIVVLKKATERWSRSRVTF